MPRPRLPRNVIALGLVSLFTDLSSEMIYPLLPIFLTVTLGAGPAVLGIIEGIPEATASLLKLFSGAWSDRLGRKKPLVVGGYLLSSVARPLMGLAAGWGHVLAVRFSDRIRKGIRRSPRDAPIAAPPPPAGGFLHDGDLPPVFLRYLGIVSLFTLGNASDAFLILRAVDTGVPAAWVPLLWGAFHVVKSSLSTYAGILSDRWSRKHLIVAGGIVYATCYAARGVAEGPAGGAACFGVRAGLGVAASVLLLFLSPPSAPAGSGPEPR